MNNKPLPIASFTTTRKATHIFEHQDGFIWIRTASNNAGFPRESCVPFTPDNSLAEEVICDPGVIARNGRAYFTSQSKPVLDELNLVSDLNAEDKLGLIEMLGSACGALRSSASGIDNMPDSRPVPDIIELLDIHGSNPYGSEVAHAALESIRQFVDNERLNQLVTWYKSQHELEPCHGEFSLANMVRSDENKRVSILMEDSLPVAPVAFDAGWFLGDLYENIMSPMGAFDEISAVHAGRLFLSSYSREAGLDLVGLSENLHYSFILRLLYHYVQFRISAYSPSHEEYFLEAINDLFVRQPFTFTGELFGFEEVGGLVN
ncbi:hypothetical protein QNO08_17190 (plasmid) [Arthrobacter sp. zg-Y820]|uniref:hypothetical protein n=1 Tax=unclassified Arthrobacter TaxID=235627 RepID=UPI001E53FE44|nr:MULTISPECIES: hypothetical protein [unclassified Arthrobacter]MCC9198536.1 hypothetical protein [Arthrobacter sp. zg-Y820]MDK1281406.1 hypothetical protein [Arthrobacter sp. zg.Y820]WIB11250.1 hypothetical protein QNO08_17190 [Arthrobacter sp. zg-Y820]